jgi:hypothetical protein
MTRLLLLRRRASRPWVVLLLCGACAQVDPCEGVQDQSLSPAGLSVTREEHGPGWAQAECFTCHQLATIHRADCIDGVDMATVMAQADPEDPSTCAGCHGANGVPWLAEAPPLMAGS